MKPAPKKPSASDQLSRQVNQRVSPLRMTQKEMDQLDERVYAYLRSYQLSEGRAPSREELARALGLSGIMAAQRSVKRLRAKNLLYFAQNSKRGIEITEPEEKKPVLSADLPLLGVVAAGEPIEVIEEAEMITVPAFLIRPSSPHFVLKVRGNSMIEAHICSGDWVIIKKQETAQNGQIVVALLDQLATLKRFEQKHDKVFLHPANSNLNSIEVGSHQELRVLGVYAGLIRKK